MNKKIVFWTIIVVSFLSGVVIVLVYYPFGTDSWPMLYANPGRTGHLDTQGVFEFNGVKWRLRKSEDMTTAPAVTGGRVFVGYSNKLYALSEQTGEEIWVTEIEGLKKNGRQISDISGSPAISGDKVYVGVGRLDYEEEVNGIYVFDKETGKKIWSYITGAPIKTSPLVIDDIVYVGSSVIEVGRDNYIYALDAKTGNLIWEFDLAAGHELNVILNDIAYFNGDIFFDVFPGMFYSLDAQTGEKNWSVNLEGNLTRTPAVDKGVIFLSCSDREKKTARIQAIDAKGGEEIWGFDTDRPGLSPAVADGMVFMGLWGETSAFYAFDAETGDKIWSFEVEGKSVIKSPVIVGKTVYFGSRPYQDGGSSQKREIYALDRVSGEKRWKHSMEIKYYRFGSEQMMSPVVVNGALYFPDGYGQLSVFY